LREIMRRVAEGDRQEGERMTDKVSDRIDSLEERLKKLKEQRQKSAARRRTVQSRRSRREETRRKILVGAIVLAKVEQGLLERETLTAWLSQALIRADDRALFDLPTEDLDSVQRSDSQRT
jgi:septal ring factor EnvC (AmiA/AmiB activator)